MNARIEALAPEALPTPELQGEVERLLGDGQLVVLPTETVYGIAARADRPEALQKLRDLKKRPDAGLFTLHLPSAAAAEPFNQLPRLRERLAEHYWPGPLTLVMQGESAVAQDGWTGLRVPAHNVTRALLEGIDAPVVMTSANPSGAAPLVEAEEIARTFGDGIGLIVDCGKSDLGTSSTVLRLAPGHFEILREGFLSLEDLQAAAGLRILFVCTGNTCRSPMAEGLARRAIAARLGVGGAGEVEGLARFGFRIHSAGVHAGPGAPISAHSASVLGERDIDLRDHTASSVFTDTLDAESHIYCLTRSHLDALMMSMPAGELPQAALLDPEGRDIPDPIGGPLELYRETADHIQAAIDARLAQWVG